MRLYKNLRPRAGLRVGPLLGTTVGKSKGVGTHGYVKLGKRTTFRLK